MRGSVAIVIQSRDLLVVRLGSRDIALVDARSGQLVPDGGGCRGGHGHGSQAGDDEADGVHFSIDCLFFSSVYL